MSAAPPFPTRLKVWLGVQLALAVLFFFFFWSQTVSLAQGRPASWQDLLALALPALLVIAFGIAAAWLWRRGQPAMVSLLVVMPFPAAIMAYAALGAI